MLTWLYVLDAYSLHVILAYLLMHVMNEWWNFYGSKFEILIHPPQKFTFHIVIPTIGIRAEFLEQEALQLWGKDLEIEVYKLGRIIENQGLEIQLILHQLDEAREELKN